MAVHFEFQNAFCGAVNVLILEWFGRYFGTLVTQKAHSIYVLFLFGAKSYDIKFDQCDNKLNVLHTQNERRHFMIRDDNGNVLG